MKSSALSSMKYAMNVKTKNTCMIEIVTDNTLKT